MGYPVCSNRIHSSGINGPWKSLIETTKSLPEDGHRLKLFFGVWESGEDSIAASLSENNSKYPNPNNITDTGAERLVYTCQCSIKYKTFEACWLSSAHAYTNKKYATAVTYICICPILTCFGSSEGRQQIGESGITENEDYQAKWGLSTDYFETFQRSNVRRYTSNLQI